MNQLDTGKFSKAMGLNTARGSNTPNWLKDSSTLPDREQIVRGALDAIQNDPEEEQKRKKLIIQQEALKLMQKFFCQRTSEGNTKTIERMNISLQNTPLDKLKEYIDTLYISPEEITNEMVEGFVSVTKYDPQDKQISNHLPEILSTYFRANDLNTINEIRTSAKSELRDTTKQVELDWIRKFKVNDNIPDGTVINSMQIKPRTA